MAGKRKVYTANQVSRENRKITAEKIMTSKKGWQEFEAVVKKLISKLESVKAELRLTRIEGKQKIKGKSGAEWEIDIVGYDTDSGKPVLVECKYWSSQVPQDVMASLAYRTNDIGGARSIIVTTVGLQKGAKEIAKHENIEVILLNREATSDEFHLVLPNRGEHHIGKHAVVELKDEVQEVKLPEDMNSER